MRKKQLILLLVILVAIVAATVGMKAYQSHQEKAATQKQKDETVYVDQFDADKVTAFSYENDGKTLKFIKEDDTWKLDGKTSVSLDSDSVQDMLDTLSGMTATNTIPDVEDLSEYGLNKPTQTVALVFQDGSTKTLLFGMENQITGGYYVQADEGKDIYLVDSSYLTSTLNKSVDDLKKQESTDTDTKTDTTTSTDSANTKSDTSDSID